MIRLNIATKDRQMHLGIVLITQIIYLHKHIITQNVIISSTKRKVFISENDIIKTVSGEL